FQAEDGIRGRTVTGVQTCALPILQKDLLPWLKGELSIVVSPATTPPFPNVGILIQPTDKAALERTMNALPTRLGALLGSRGKVRSEERRVGREWRGRVGWGERRLE